MALGRMEATMRIKEINIKNFRGIGECDTKIKINENLDILLLVGPNGFGKTTFFDAVEWAFTGKINRIDELKDVDKTRFNMGKFINYQIEGDKKNRFAEVKLAFDDNSTLIRTNSKGTYEDVGDYSKSTISYTKNGKKLKEQKSFELDFIEDKFQNSISFSEQFYYSHILGQDTINSFIHNYRGDARQEKIFQILGMKNYQDLLDILDINRGMYKKFNNEVNRRKNNYEQLLSKVDSLKEDVNSYLEKCNLDEINLLCDKLKFQFTQLLSICDDINLNLFEDKVKQRMLTFNLKDIIALKKELEVARFNITKVIDNCKEKIKQYNNLRNNISIIKDLEIIQTKINENERLEHLIANYGCLNMSLVNKTFERRYQKNLNLLKSKTTKQLELFKKWIDVITHFSFQYNDKDCEDYRKIISEAYEELKSLKVGKLEREEFYSYYNKLNTILPDLEVNMQKYLELKGEWNALNLQLETNSKINNNYKSALIEFKKYIEANNELIDREKICPLCLQELEYNESVNLNISKSISSSEKLLAAINFTFSSGDESIRVFTEAVNIRKQSLTNAKLEIDAVIQSVKTIQDDVLKKLVNNKDKLIKKRESLIMKIQDSKNEYYSRCRNEREKYIKINEIRTNLLCNIEKDEEILSKANELISNNSLILTQIYGKLDVNGVYISDKKDRRLIISKLQELKKESEDIKSEYFSDSISKLEEFSLTQFIDSENLKLTNYNTALHKLDNIRETFFPEGLKEDIFNIADQETELKKLKKDYEDITADSRILKALAEKIDLQKENIIKSKIEKNGLVCSLYEAINPHPFYRELRLKQRNQGIEITCDESGERFFLDYILSSAQNNVLALSIFMGFALQQQWSKLNQIFIDDPIQNMDDINILSFIDILRSLFNENNMKKQIIISTHDFKLAELFRKKFRFLNMEIVRYETYTKEGPIIKQYDKNLQLI